MKALTKTELIELCPPDGATLAGALSRFETAAPVLCREHGYCRELIAEGWSKPVQINCAGRPVFLICYRQTFDGGFWVDIAQTLNGGAPTAVMFETVEKLARQSGARYMRFATMRRGLVKLACQFGFEPEAVLCVKQL